MDNQEQTTKDANLNNDNNLNDYRQKWSTRAYKFFSLLTFFVYYINLSVRIIVRTFDYYELHGVENIVDWFRLMFDTTKWAGMVKEIFDWYTIVLTIFLLMYAIVFFVLFVRFSPKKKKTFKYFKKGFTMARRFIKVINIALSLTVLINTVNLTSTNVARFGDKFTLVVSVLSLMITLMQIAMTITTWSLKKKIRTRYQNVKDYVGKMGKTMSSYLSRPDNLRKSNVGAGKKVGVFKSRFLNTIEAMSANDIEAEQTLSDIEQDYERFENDYQTQVINDDVQNNENIEIIDTVVGKERKHRKHGKKNVNIIVEGDNISIEHIDKPSKKEETKQKRKEYAQNVKTAISNFGNNIKNVLRKKDKANKPTDINIDNTDSENTSEEQPDKGDNNE